MKILVKNVFLPFFITCIVFLSCSKDDIQVTPNEPINEITNPYHTQHFSFHITSYDSTFIPEISGIAESNYDSILTHLLIDTVLKTEVHFYRTHEELANAVRYIVPNLPVWAIGLSTAKDTIHMISPKHPEQNYEYMLSVLVHEFAHCVTLNINPNFANNPRWLWESVAIYESGQFIHPNQIPYMVSHNPPTLSQLNNFNNTQIYEIGFLLAEYIVINWDRQHLKDLIISNGNIQSSLGVSVSDFQVNWFEFVKTRYNI